MRFILEMQRADCPKEDMEFTDGDCAELTFGKVAGAKEYDKAQLWLEVDNLGQAVEGDGYRVIRKGSRKVLRRCIASYLRIEGY